MSCAASVKLRRSTILVNKRMAANWSIGAPIVRVFRIIVPILG
jgi:hypothetical protein